MKHHGRLQQHLPVFVPLILGQISDAGAIRKRLVAVGSVASVPFLPFYLGGKPRTHGGLEEAVFF